MLRYCNITLKTTLTSEKSLNQAETNLVPGEMRLKEELSAELTSIVLSKRVYTYLSPSRMTVYLKSDYFGIITCNSFAFEFHKVPSVNYHYHPKDPFLFSSFLYSSFLFSCFLLLQSISSQILFKNTENSLQQ